MDLRISAAIQAFSQSFQPISSLPEPTIAVSATSIAVAIAGRNVRTDFPRTPSSYGLILSQFRHGRQFAADPFTTHPISSGSVRFSDEFVRVSSALLSSLVDFSVFYEPLRVNFEHVPEFSLFRFREAVFDPRLATRVYSTPQSTAGTGKTTRYQFGTSSGNLHL